MGAGSHSRSGKAGILILVWLALVPHSPWLPASGQGSGSLHLPHDLPHQSPVLSLPSPILQSLLPWLHCQPLALPPRSPWPPLSAPLDFFLTL